jgi:AcrR family transcriptional regulator
MVDSALALLRERSSAGVTIDSILTHSGSPRGSVYHHFPGGRDQIILDAVARAGRHVSGLIDDPEERTPVAVVRRLLDFWEQVLRETDFLAGCPVVALTVDVPTSRPEAIDLVASTFTHWHMRLVAVLRESAVGEERSHRLATLLIAAAEGAVLLCRALRSATPLHDIYDELLPLIANGSADGATEAGAVTRPQSERTGSSPCRVTDARPTT